MTNIINNPHDPIKEKLYSVELIDIIDRLLTKDPKKRPSIQELTEVPIIRDAIQNFRRDYQFSNKMKPSEKTSAEI
jgi:serine/threonine protein kinase